MGAANVATLIPANGRIPGMPSHTAVRSAVKPDRLAITSRSRMLDFAFPGYPVRMGRLDMTISKN